MSDVHDQRIFSAEQIEVPDSFPGILKNLIKAVVRNQPEDQISFARAYFEDLLHRRTTAMDKIHGEVAEKMYLKRTDTLRDHYDIFETLGESSLTRYRRAVHKMSQEQRAVKIVKKADFQADEKNPFEEKLTEITRFDHPNIGPVIEVFEDEKRLYFVNELQMGGTLYERLTKENHAPEEQVASIIRQLLAATEFLHDNGITHRDIKPSNILFRNEDDDQIALVDFGTSQRIGDNPFEHNVHGSSYYTAPEVIEGTYNEKCDVYSIGVIYYTLLCGYPPYDGISGEEVLSEILKGDLRFEGPIWNSISPKAKALIKKMLAPQSERLSAGEALHHPYFEKLQEAAEAGITKMSARNVGVAISNLRTFRTNTRLRQICLSYLKSHFHRMQDQVSLQDAFKELDLDGNGVLSPQECLIGFKKIMGDDFDQEELKQLFDEADTNHDGMLSYDEWCDAINLRQKFQGVQGLEEVFTELDTNQNNLLSLNEIMGLMQSTNVIDDSQQQMFAEAFEAVDVDNQGHITFMQFKELWTRILSN